MPIPKEILDLVERFEQNREAYKTGHYKETQLRHEFLDPLFKALGWDINNEQGYAEPYKEVIHEDAIKIGGFTKAPDYCFRIGGQRKFFVEAKEPSLDLKTDAKPAYQLRRYAWSAKLPLSILTDFEEFVVYDCRVKPSQSDNAATARTFYITYKEYAAKWDEITAIFAKESILKGSFDRYAESTKAKKGTATVDDSFLEEIERWRDLLAHNLATRNPKLTNPELNYAVQATIDRIIFLRICEDRGADEYGRLMSLLNGPNIYGRLKEIFQRADERYNSGLFHFHHEKDRHEEPDRLTPSLDIDDTTLKDIIKHLYYPDSPFEFSVLPADILGHVYEQFLGKVIHLTEGHHAKIEDKPEVKKAGGVYYTPTYIVDYIVKNTVGKLLEGKTPKQVSKLKILDPACGSGSFLINAYQYLLDWHLVQYIKDGPDKHKKELYQGPGGAWRLASKERKRILVNNIYGVDIDSQAVEVTKLSLLLKVLEGENDQSIRQQLELFHERALPDLADNIKCGNSLIGPNFYEGKQAGLFNEDESRKINAFDWNKEFKEAMDAGGFDAIIGNPPYIRIQAMKEWAPIEVEYYKEAYSSAAKGNYDIYVVFIEKGLHLLNARGRFGFICPHKFFNAQYGKPIRELVAKGQHLAEVIHFGDQQVFADATTYTCLLFLDKKGANECRFLKVKDLAAWRQKQRDDSESDEGQIPAASITASEWNFSIGKDTALIEKLSRMPFTLEKVTSRIFQGIKTGADKIYIVEARERSKEKVRVFSPHLDVECWLEPDLLHPLVKGGDSRRYALSMTDRLILFPYSPDLSGKTSLVPEVVFKRKYPLTWEYLECNRKYLSDREDGKMSGQTWYAYSRTQALDVMPLPKIFTPDIAPNARFSLDRSGAAFFTGGVAGGYGILSEKYFNREYLLGLLNSRLIDWFHHQFASQMRGGWYSYESRFICNLPIRPIDCAKKTDIEMHDRMVNLVQTMLDLRKNRLVANTPTEQARLDREIEVTDQQIDRLVYELYDLTEDDIKIVEGVAK